MPAPLRNGRLDALNIALAKGDATLSVWSRKSMKCMMFFVGASACFEGELYDLTDVGWVLREGEDKERALCLSPTRPVIEGDQQQPLIEGVAEAQGRASASCRCGLLIEDCAQCPETKTLADVRAEQAQKELTEPAVTLISTDQPENITKTEPVVQPPPEEQPIVKTPGRKQAVQA